MDNQHFETASLDRAAYLCLSGIAPLEVRPASTDPRRRIWIFAYSDELRTANHQFSDGTADASIIRGFIDARHRVLNLANAKDAGDGTK